jgi:transcription elongation GreA/GreB family factor
VQVVTPRSPLGQILLGKQAGDEVELKAGARARTMEIVEVA